MNENPPADSAQVNQCVLTAQLTELSALRFTPAGVPALNCVLSHESQTKEADAIRDVKLSLKAVAFGVLAERLAKQDIGSPWCFKGFLANPRSGKQVVFHIQEFSII